LVNEYELIPTHRKKGTNFPKGWVHLDPGMNTKRRTMTEGYLLQRMPRTNTISANQHYVEKVMSNPRTPFYNKQVVMQFVRDHPEKFMALCDRTDDDFQNEWARKKNNGARFGWIQWLKSSYPQWM